MSWRYVSKRTHYFQNSNVITYLPWSVWSDNITFHIAVDEDGMEKSMRSLNYTEYVSLNTRVRESSYRPDFVSIEKTSDLYSYMIDKMVSHDYYGFKDRLLSKKVQLNR